MATLKSCTLLLVFLFAVLVKETHHLWAHAGHHAHEHSVSLVENDGECLSEAVDTEGGCLLCDWSFSPAEKPVLTIFSPTTRIVDNFAIPQLFLDQPFSETKFFFSLRAPPAA